MSMTETWWVTWLCYNLNSILVSMDSFKFENRVENNLIWLNGLIETLWYSVALFIFHIVLADICAQYKGKGF